MREWIYYPACEQVCVFLEYVYTVRTYRAHLKRALPYRRYTSYEENCVLVFCISNWFCIRFNYCAENRLPTVDIIFRVLCRIKDILNMHLKMY